MDNTGVMGLLKKAFQADLFGTAKPPVEQMSFAPKDPGRIGEVRQFGPGDFRMLLTGPSGKARWMDKKEVEETIAYHKKEAAQHTQHADDLQGKAITPLVPYAKYQQTDFEGGNVPDAAHTKIGDLYFTAENPVPPELKKLHDQYMAQREEHVAASRENERQAREFEVARDILHKKGLAKSRFGDFFRFVFGKSATQDALFDLGEPNKVSSKPKKDYFNTPEGTAVFTGETREFAPGDIRKLWIVGGRGGSVRRWVSTKEDKQLGMNFAQGGKEEKQAETPAEKPEKERMSEEAKRLGIEYRGPQQFGVETLHVFQDPLSKGSFSVKHGGNVEAELKRKREEITDGKQKSASEGKDGEAVQSVTPEEVKKLSNFTLFKKKKEELPKIAVVPEPVQEKEKPTGGFTIGPKVGGKSEIYQIPKSEYMAGKKPTPVSPIDFERLGTDSGLKHGEDFESKTDAMERPLIVPREGRASFTKEEEVRLQQSLTDQGYRVHGDYMPNTMGTEDLKSGFRIEPMDIHEVIHKNAVKNAIARGAAIPEDVMKDYPDLQAEKVEQVGTHAPEKVNKLKEKPTEGEIFDLRNPKHIAILSKVNEGMPEGAEIYPHPETKLPFESDREALQEHLDALGYKFGGALFHNDEGEPKKYEFEKKQKKPMTWSAKMGGENAEAD